MNRKNLIRVNSRSTRKKNLAGLLGSFLCLAGLSAVSGQAAEPGAPEVPRPSGPAWVKPKAPIRWTIEFRYPGTAGKDLTVEGRVTKVTITSAGNTTLESVQCAKASYDVWSSEGYTFLVEPATGQFDLRGSPFPSEEPFVEQRPKTKGAPVVKVERPPLPPQYQDWSGLSEFDWIKPELFQGTIKQGTETLHVYADLPEDMRAAPQTATPAVPAATAPARPGGLGRPASPAAPARQAQKWPIGPIGGLPLRPDIKVVAVNAETRTPHFLQLGEIVREYVFNPVSASALELPKPIVQALKTLGR